MQSYESADSIYVHTVTKYVYLITYPQTTNVITHYIKLSMPSGQSFAITNTAIKSLANSIKLDTSPGKICANSVSQNITTLQQRHFVKQLT